MTQYAKTVEQPYNHCDNDNDVENLFYRFGHRDVSVDEPEQNTDDDER